MRGRLQAMTVASTLALLSLLIPPVNIVSLAAMALVTLRRGAYEGLIVLGSSTFFSAILGYVLIGHYQFTLSYLLVLWFPVWLISLVLREGRHLSWAIEIAILLGMIGVVGFYSYKPDIATLWKEMLSAMLSDEAPLEAPQMIEVMSHYMTGIVAGGSVISLLLGLFLGRWWQALLYNPCGFSAEFLALQSQRSIALLSVLLVVFAASSSDLSAEIAWNLSILAFVMYSIIGTATLHSLLASRQQARYTLYVLYVTLFLIPHVVFVVALLGLLDPWLNLRKKTL